MSLRTFCLRIFRHCPLLSQFSEENHTRAFEEFIEYKTRIPVRGAILLNDAMDSAVLVKGFKKNGGWGFPQGKINKDEDDLDCAIREVYEETGFDARVAGLVPADGKPKYIQLPIKNHQVRLYVFRGVSMDTDFQPRTRKEISRIEWHKLSELPTFRKKAGQSNPPNTQPVNANKFYMVTPFVIPLKKWVVAQKKAERKATEANTHTYSQLPAEELPTEEDAWTQVETDAPADASSHVAAIDTLDGATRELQRLLKMQPPTQGRQRPPQEQQQLLLPQDKGTALLSILQAGKSSPAAAAQQPSPTTHTPLGNILVDVPKPRNPHHLTNLQGGHVDLHQPPPTFPVAQGHPSLAPIAQHQALSPDLRNYQLPQGSGHQEGDNERSSFPLPQPRQTQIHGPLLNDNSDLSRLPPLQQIPTLAQSHVGPTASTQQLPSQQLHSAPPQGQPATIAPSPTRHRQLNGQSMALLSAFKRDGPAPSSSHPAAPVPTGSAINRDLQGRPLLPSEPPRGAPQLGASSNSNPQKRPAELISGPADQHRSALLGIFKKGEPASRKASTSHAPDSTPLQQAAQTGPASGNDLLSLFQRRPRQPEARTQPLEPDHQQSEVDSNSLLLMKHLAIQPQQPVVRVPNNAQQDAVGHPPLQYNGQIPSPHGGQFADAISNAPPPSSSAPSDAQVMARPVTESEQKRQLLSLFGKQPTPPSSMVGAVQRGLNEPTYDSRPTSLSHQASMTPSRGSRSAAPDAGSTSSHRSGEVPISPAEQSFLLGYLQSVTSSDLRPHGSQRS